MDSLPIRQKGVINWLLMYQKYHNTWANRCSSTFTVTILKYLSVRFLQQLLLGNFKFRIYPQMFAKTTFVLKDGWIIYIHTQEMGHNGSRGRPESVALEFLSWRRTEVKLSLPKVGESWKLALFLLLWHVRLVVWGDVRTCMTKLAGVWRLGMCGIDSGPPR